MIIGMMSLCTVSTFGKNNVQPRENDMPRQEVIVNNRHDKGISNMDKRHMDNGKTYRMDVRHNPEPKPVPQPEPRPIHHNNVVKDVTTGVIVGTVIGGIISTLVH